MNKPYVKEYSSEGVLLNPIVKDDFVGGKTFLGYNREGEMVFFPNRKERKNIKSSKNHHFNNRKPINTRGKHISGRIPKFLLSLGITKSLPILATK